jgi:hypothetical protein
MAQRERAADNRTMPMDAVRAALKSQYHAALTMLKTAIRRCPDELWDSSGTHANSFWRMAYHTLYYAHLYLQPNNWVFSPWEHQYHEAQLADRLRAATGAGVGWADARRRARVRRAGQRRRRTLSKS